VRSCAGPSYFARRSTGDRNFVLASRRRTKANAAAEAAAFLSDLVADDRAGANAAVGCPENIKCAERTQHFGSFVGIDANPIIHVYLLYVSKKHKSMTSSQGRRFAIAFIEDSGLLGVNPEQLGWKSKAFRSIPFRTPQSIASLFGRCTDTPPPAILRTDRHRTGIELRLRAESARAQRAGSALR
jgi:hypothetical protein